AQRAVDDLQLYAVAVMLDECCGKSGKAVTDLECDARLRRRVGMTDAGLRKCRAQAIEDRLIGDLPRKTDIARRYFSDLRRHQRATPMRRRAGQIRNAMLG